MARGRPLSVLITDIDRFKQSTTPTAMMAATRCCGNFQARVRSTIRGADLACRYGGEEFVVMMPDTSPEIAAAVAERLRAAIENAPFMLKHSGEALNVTASFGIASRIASVLTPGQL